MHEPVRRPRPRPVLSDLRDDLLDASTGYPDALQAVRRAFSSGDSGRNQRENCALNSCLIRWLLARHQLRIRLAHATLVAAYITLVAASVFAPAQ